MLSMKIETLVGALVDQMLIKGKVDTGALQHPMDARAQSALHFHFDLSMSHYVEGPGPRGGNSYRQRRGMHLLYHMPMGYGSVSVFSAITYSPFTKVREVDGWDHQTTHDSCWRNIRVFSATYFEMAKLINADLEQDGLPPIAPASMNEYNSVALSAPMFDWVPVSVVKDPTDTNNYRRTVQVLTQYPT